MATIDVLVLKKEDPAINWLVEDPAINWLVEESLKVDKVVDDGKFSFI